MKTPITLVLTSLLICMSCQEQPDKKEISGIVVISGMISNHGEKDLKLNDFLGKNQERRKVIEVSDNSFEERLDLEKPVMKILHYDNMLKQIYLQPDKSLKVYFDANDIENTFRYEGDLAMENTILDSVSNKLEVDYQVAYNNDLQIALEYLDSLKRVSKEFLQKLTTDNQTSPEFNKYATAFIDYKIARLKLYAGIRNGEQSNDYYAFVDELSLTDPDLLDIGVYRFFLYSYIDKESTLRLEKLDSVDKLSPDAKFLEGLAVIEQLENDEVRAYSLFNAMVMKLRMTGVNDFEKHYNYFNRHNSDPHYSKQLELAFAEKSKLAPGQSAPEFALIDINDEEKSLSDFKGQYVLLDFWNSRCGRCRKELPYFMELQSDYENENIAFVTISNDPDPSAWKTYVKKNKNVGSSLWTEKFWDSETFKAYQVRGTPTYVLVDKEGKIIDPVAPKPSSPELRETLNELLEIR